MEAKDKDNVITVYHNPHCAKSRAALQLLRRNNAEVEIVEYIKVGWTKTKLKQLIKMLDMETRHLVRKNEKDYKDNYKYMKKEPDEWIEAMVKYPKLVERPIAVKGNKAVIGRPPHLVLELLED